MGQHLGCTFCKDKTPVLDLTDKVRFMKAVKLFKNLSEADLKNLADTCQTAMYGKGAVIYHQGDYGEELFIIASGTVAVSIDGDKIAYELSAGDHFGENALLRDCPRTVSVTTETPMQVLKITRQHFQEMDLHLKLDFQKRRAIAGHAPEHKVVTQPPSQKTDDDVACILRAIKENRSLSSIIELEDDQCQLLCDVAWERTVTEGENVMTQGSMEADYFYIVKDGSLEIDITVPDDEVVSDDHAVHSHMQQVGTIRRGRSFGELALLFNTPRFATVKALELSTIWVIDRNTFKRGCARKADHYAKMYAKYLENSESFASLKDDERHAVAKALQESNFGKDEVIFEQGEDGTSFYILYEGEVSASRDDKEVVRLKASPEKVEIFGELALIQGEAYSTTMRVVSETAKTLSLDKESFEMLLGPMAAIMKRGKEGGDSMIGQGAYAAAVEAAKREGRQQIFFSDLKTLGILGHGGFGTVELVEHKTTKETYAMKKLSKGFIVEGQQQKEVMMEKNIQSRCDSDFIVRLYETYNGEQSLYLLLELGLGGELYHTYQSKKLWGNEAHAKFYTAGVVFAFEHMHRKKMIFRDLKPENILFNDKGHGKLTDMGLATICIGKTFTTCGTAPYMSPEVINSSGHNHAADWWTLGILTYELMSGHTPFEASSQALIFAKTQKGINQVMFPSSTPSPMRMYVKAMCKSEPAERLAMKKGGSQNVKDHDWYKGFDWVAAKNLTLPPPYVPVVQSTTDLANFENQDEAAPPVMLYVDDGSGWDQDFATSAFERPSTS